MNWRPALAGAILLLAAVLAAAILLDRSTVNFFVGPLRFIHWTAWAGFLFIGVYAPLYHFLKKAYPRSAKTLLDIHTFGFLLAFLLITVHFAGQLSRPAQSAPELGEGIALFITVLLMVTTGLLQRFGAQALGTKSRYTVRTNRTVHVSLLSAFYIIVAVHILTTMNVI